MLSSSPQIPNLNNGPLFVSQTVGCESKEMNSNSSPNTHTQAHYSLNLCKVHWRQWVWRSQSYASFWGNDSPCRSMQMPAAALAAVKDGSN